jgi:nucleotide-binding universal stress UspA family protein
MKNPKKIIVPTDLSLNSLEALRYAEELADPLETEIVILHAIEKKSMEPVQPGSAQTDTAELDIRKRLIHQLTKNRMIHRDLRIELTRHAPVVSILEAAKRLHADLIVMTTHGRTGLSHTLLGSVAEEVVRYSPVPVLIVKFPGSQSSTLCEEDIQNHLHLN